MPSNAPLPLPDTAELERLLEAADFEAPLFAYTSEQGPTVQTPSGWVALLSWDYYKANKQAERAALIVAAVNGLPAMIEQNASLTGKLEEIKTVALSKGPFDPIWPDTVLEIINRSAP